MMGGLPARGPVTKPPDESPVTAKGEETRQRILAAALDLFREKGYVETTMRAVAERAGVSIGNAYYYYASKENLLQGYYAESHAQHAEACRPILARERTLKARLAGVLHAKLETSEPYHRFAGLLFAVAADPKSPLNPFGPASAPARAEGIDIMRQALSGSSAKVPKDLAARLPELLWLHEMGIILYWIHDDSAGRARSRALVERSTDLVVRLISLASNPLLRPLRKATLRMLEETLGDMAGRPALPTAAPHPR